ncbi:MAG: hypothetical protein K6G84_05935, partial [Lachnospiraceae bacterium]|nr:hypothetical protein [Lachnospiraceae bacterium]
SELNKFLENNPDAKKVEITLKDATLTLPRSAVESILDAFGDDVDFDLSVALNDISSDTASWLEEELGIKNAKQSLWVGLRTLEDTVEASSVHDHFVDFAEPAEISFAATDATKALKTGFVYATNSGEELGSDDVTDSKVDFKTPYLDGSTMFVVAEEAEKKGWVSANFTNAAYWENPDDKLSGYVEYGDYVSFVDDGEAKEIVKTANKDNGFKVTAPLAVLPEFKFVKWAQVEWRNNKDTGDPIGFVVKDVKNATIAAGAEATFDPVLTKYDSYEVEYVAIFEKLDTVSKNVLKDINGHTVEVAYNKTPAFTGKKLNGGNIVTKVLLDGKDVTDAAKFKIKGGKTVGSEVTVTIKSIKGLDKDTNKALKDKEIGTVKIRPIEVSEVTVLSKYFTQEGQIAVKLKGDTVKKVTVMVPNNRKFDKNKGDVLKVKKLSVKKGTYEYDSSTKLIKFDGTVLNGTVKVGIRSK